MFFFTFCWDRGLVVGLRTPDQGVPGSNTARTTVFFRVENSNVCFFLRRFIIGYPDRMVFVQVCYSLSTISMYAA